jgi:hypothetical protein
MLLRTILSWLPNNDTPGRNKRSDCVISQDMEGRLIRRGQSNTSNRQQRRAKSWRNTTWGWCMNKATRE